MGLLQTAVFTACPGVNIIYSWLPVITYLNIAALGVSNKKAHLCTLQGVWGFIAGGLCWFAIPFGLATTMGLAYLGLSSAQGAPMLSDEDVMKGENNGHLREVLDDGMDTT